MFSELRGNMKNYKNIFKIMLSFILLAGLISLGYLLITKFWAVFSILDPKLTAALLAASATILVSVISVIFSKRQEQRVAIENQLREKKVPVYEEIINFIFRITFAEKLSKKQPSEKEMIKFFADTTRDLVIWGSHDMIKAFSEFREELVRLFDKHDNAPWAIVACVEDLLIAIRNDLGHKHKNIQRGEILRLYITDLPEKFPIT